MFEILKAIVPVIASSIIVVVCVWQANRSTEKRKGKARFDSLEGERSSDKGCIQEKTSLLDEEEKQEDEENYIVLGMCLGMSFGITMSLIFDSISLAVGISIGMLVGMTVGINMKKCDESEKD